MISGKTDRQKDRQAGVHGGKQSGMHAWGMWAWGMEAGGQADSQACMEADRQAWGVRSTSFATLPPLTARGGYRLTPGSSFPGGMRTRIALASEWPDKDQPAHLRKINPCPDCRDRVFPQAGRSRSFSHAFRAASCGVPRAGISGAIRIPPWRKPPRKQIFPRDHHEPSS